MGRPRPRPSSLRGSALGHGLSVTGGGDADEVPPTETTAVPPTVPRQGTRGARRHPGLVCQSRVEDGQVGPVKVRV